MTEVPKITKDEAAMLVTAHLMNKEFSAVARRLHDIGCLLDMDDPTDLGRAALANFEAEREREIRAPLVAQIKHLRSAIELATGIAERRFAVTGNEPEEICPLVEALVRRHGTP